VHVRKCIGYSDICITLRVLPCHATWWLIIEFSHCAVHVQAGFSFTIYRWRSEALETPQELPTQLTRTNAIWPSIPWFPTFYGKGPHLLLWAGPRAACKKITVNSIPNRLTYCVIFILYTWFTNVVAGRTIQPGGPHGACGPRIGNPCSIRVSHGSTASALLVHRMCLTRCTLIKRECRVYSYVSKINIV
jgi:hypothetical protein